MRWLFDPIGPFVHSLSITLLLSRTPDLFSLVFAYCFATVSELNALSKSVWLM